MEKLDLKKTFKNLYAPSAKNVELIEVPEFNFVMIDGRVAAGESPQASTEFQDAMQALYGAAYTLKFMSKLSKVNPVDYTVMALEGLWWVPSGQFDFLKREDWLFTLMIMHPDHITAEMFQEALQQLRKKKPGPALDKLRFERFAEGLSIQVMHMGPYSQEPATLERMDAFAQENNLRYRGKHHEIYLGDPRKAQPEKLKTVLRHPVERI
ncbi:MAG: GyrI-like domain-containing protein [Chloroflexota bacterium]